jgi:alpha-beta hydrolase superfamily lysophospholipase
MEERTLTDAYGIEVCTRWWTVDEPRGIVLVSHGASEHSLRYDRFARALNAERFTVAALDHRGHGCTAPSTGPGVAGPGGGDALVDDLRELHEAAESAAGAGVPVFLFGHSMGSLLALAYLTRYADGLAGGILCGFAADLDQAASLGALLQGLADAGMRDEPATDLLSSNNAPFEPARTPFDWLSRDPDEVDRYLADPMCGDDNPLTYGFLVDMFDVVAPAGEQLASISCPVLVIAGDQDPAAGMGTHATKVAEALRAAGVDVDITLYEGARHELLNETNRDEVTADVVVWLQRRG